MISKKKINKLASGLLILGLAILFTTQVEGASIYNGSSTYYNSVSSVPTEKCKQSVCPANPEPFCWNSQAVGVTDCGFACQKGDPWARYTFSGCVVEPGTLPPPGFDEVCTDAYARDANTCSTGDKFNSANPPVLNAGFCSCTVGGPYKTCCSNGRAVDANAFAVDPYEPLEGGCGNNAIVFCGGAGQPACGPVACALPATPTPTPIGCKTDAASAVGCEVGCAINPANGKLEKCHIYNRNTQGVCDSQCRAGGPWNCVPDLSCSSPGGGGVTPTPTPCSGPNCCTTPGATRLDCRPTNVCSL